MTVCLFTGLLVSACVCLSRFSLFPPPHLIQPSCLFVSWCSSLCSLLVSPQEACRSHYSPKKCYSAIHPQFFQSIPLTLKPKESLREKKTGNFRDSFLPVSPFYQESFQLNVVKMDFHWLVSGWKKIELCVHNPEPRTVQVQKQWGEG